ncbi:MAG: hypothetical protein JNL11_02165 [Bdellovibrionaceae bacterium]|nr:hypothetical protein [Pseudobdellovibrionaceae bacterium]
MRKNEFSRLKINYLGRFFHPNNKEVRRAYPVTNLEDILKKELGKIRKFKDTLVELSPTISRKYQKVGIHDIVQKTEKSKNFFHFELGFVYRDQEKFETYDESNSNVEDIEIDGSKYRHIRLHFTIVPSYNTIILDNKCFAGTVIPLLKALISLHIDSSSFMGLGQDIDNLRIKIVPVPKKNFEEILNQQYKNMKEATFMFAKPSKLKISALAEDYVPEPENKKFAELTESMMSAFFGLNKDDIKIDDLPVKSFKISMSLDDKKVKNSDKNHVKSFLKEYKDYLFADETSFKYKSANGELENALYNSAKLTSDCTVNPANFNDSGKMWSEQRSAFFSNLKRIDNNEE